MASFRMAFFRYFFFALKFRIFAWRVSSFRLFAWRYFVFSSFRIAFFFRLFVFSHGVFSSFRVSRGVFSPRIDEMAQTGHHKILLTLFLILNYSGLNFPAAQNKFHFEVIQKSDYEKLFTYDSWLD